MNLGDVLKGVGDEPLKDRTWTNAIISTLNATLPTTTVLTAESTGNQAMAAIGTLPDAERTRLLASEVDLFQGTLTISSVQQGSPSAEANAEQFRSLIMTTLLTDPKRSVLFVLCMAMALIIIVVGVTMTVTYSATGTAPDTSFIQTLMKFFLDVVSALTSNSH